MRAAALLTLLLLTPAGALAQAPVSRLAPDTETRWVPFTLTPGNQIRFTLLANGREATALLDTGVSTSLASQRFAAAAGLKTAGSGSADAIGGTVAVSWAAVESIAFGGLTRTGGRLAVADLSAIPTGGIAEIDVLIGSDMLRAHALEIDADNRRFRLLPSGRLPFTGQVAPLAIAPRTGLMVSEVAVGTARFRPMLIDSGDGSTLTLSQEATATRRLPATATTSALAYGLGGGVVSDLTVLPAVRLGAATARNIELRIEARRGFSSQAGVVGRIGNAFLQRYRVLLDPQARRMVLAPGRAADRQPLRSTSGLLVGHQGEALTVLHVMRGSPAEAGGWQAGERICAVDGTRVSAGYLGDPLSGWPADTPGRTVRLRICGGSDRSLTLQRFY